MLNLLPQEHSTAHAQASRLDSQRDNRGSALQAAREGPMRAAYHGHVLELAAQLNDTERAAAAAGDDSIVGAMQLAAGWAQFVEEVVEPRLANARRDAWEAPMPTGDSDGMMSDEFSATMELTDAYAVGDELNAPAEEVRSLASSCH